MITAAWRVKLGLAASEGGDVGKEGGELPADDSLPLPSSSRHSASAQHDMTKLRQSEMEPITSLKTLAKTCTIN